MIPSLEGLHNGSLGGASGGARLERELAAGFALDAKRKAEDAMKKRAIHTAASYDEFRNLVAASSQTPMESGDFSRRVELSANRMLGGGARGLAEPCDLGIAAPFPADNSAPVSLVGRGAIESVSASLKEKNWGAPPGSCLELDRFLRRYKGEARSEYLLWLGPARLGACFRRDVDAPVFGEAISCISHEISKGERGDVVYDAFIALAVGIVSAAPPAALSRAYDMLDDKERQSVAVLLAGAQGNSLDILKRAFD